MCSRLDGGLCRDLHRPNSIWHNLQHLLSAESKTGGNAVGVGVYSGAPNTTLGHEMEPSVADLSPDAADSLGLPSFNGLFEF
jgi:hypothetical protein